MSRITACVSLQFRTCGLFLGLAACQFLLCGQAAAADTQETQTSQTIAVVADQATIGSGIPDLLTIELAQLDGVRTVDRVTIQSIVHEQTLASAITPAGSAERLRLGQLLKADLLVFLRVSQSGDEQLLHVCISETSIGARLQTSILATDKREPDRIAADCRAGEKQVSARGRAACLRVAVHLSESRTRLRRLAIRLCRTGRVGIDAGARRGRAGD